MAQVVWTRPAMRHLREIDDFLSQRSPDAAARLIERLVRAPRLLETTPLLGRQVPEFKRADIRELVTVKPYRIVYVVKGDVCEIVAVVDGRRDFLRLVDPNEFESNGESDTAS